MATEEQVLAARDALERTREEFEAARHHGSEALVEYLDHVEPPRFLEGHGEREAKE